MHYWASAVLSIALVPALLRVHIPVRFDWARLASAFWLVLSAQAIFVAVLLAAIGFPSKTVIPALQRLWRSKLRLLLVLFYFLLLFWALNRVKALVLTVDTVAILELRAALSTDELRRKANAVFWPSLYLFAGLLLVFAYNDILVSIRFNFANDAQFEKIDEWVLHGLSVPCMSHWAIRNFPVSFFHFLEFIYFGMFAEIGGGLILMCLYDGKLRALQLVGGILLAYYITMVAFYFWPSQGPYYLCPNHFLVYPSSLQAYSIQNALIAKALALWKHIPVRGISTDFYTPFPCMHITQPLLLMWFVRRWKGITVTLAIYNIVLAVAVVLLEWHYFIDILAAVPAAALVIAIVDGQQLHSKISEGGKSRLVAASMHE